MKWTHCLCCLLLIWPALLPADAALRFDHAVIVVRDLDTAVADFAALGFTVKPGRLHANGLHNAHIKLTEGHALELMAVQTGEADALSEFYRRRLLQGEGGAALAFASADLAALSERLRDAGIQHRLQPGRLWDVLNLSGPLDGLFFIQWHARIEDAEQWLQQRNGARGVMGLCLADSAEMRALLPLLGARALDSSQRAWRLGRVQLQLQETVQWPALLFSCARIRGLNAAAELHGLRLLPAPQPAHLKPAHERSER